MCWQSNIDSFLEMPLYSFSVVCSLEELTSMLQFSLHLFYCESKAEESIDEIFFRLGCWLTEFFYWRYSSTNLDICSGNLAVRNSRWVGRAQP